MGGAEIIAAPLTAISGNNDTVIIDMKRVTFIASVGLRQLVLAAKAVGRRGGQVILRNPSTPVADVIAISALAELFVIEVDPEPQGRRDGPRS